MNDANLVDLTPGEMLLTNGGASSFNCWGGGVMTVLGLASGNAMAAAAGLFFIYNYC